MMCEAMKREKLARPCHNDLRFNTNVLPLCSVHEMYLKANPDYKRLKQVPNLFYFFF